MRFNRELNKRKKTNKGQRMNFGATTAPARELVRYTPGEPESEEDKKFRAYNRAHRQYGR